MFKEFFLKKMLNYQGIPADQAELVMRLVKNNPKLFKQVSEEAQEQMKTSNRSQQQVIFEIMQKYQREISKALEDEGKK
jgi:hypothetical protein